MKKNTLSICILIFFSNSSFAQRPVVQDELSVNTYTTTIECFDNTKRNLLIKKELYLRGFKVDTIVNGLDKSTQKALLRFQKENGLPEGNLNIETLKALGIYKNRAHESNKNLIEESNNRPAFSHIGNVREIQQELFNRGYKIDTINGVLDSTTKQALRKFHRENGLIEDRITFKTMRALGLRLYLALETKANISSNIYAVGFIYR